MQTMPLELLNTLDLEPIMVKAMDEEEGYGWTLDQALEVANEYKRFLALCMCYPDEAIVPSTFVDDFWHLHILDTQKYADDCTQYLGYFLHHFPYFGMRGDQDLKNLNAAWMRTLTLYEASFGVPANAALWPKSKRCPNCGRRSTNDSQSVSRPRLADLQQKQLQATTA